MVRVDDSGGEVKAWISRDELSQLERAAGRVGWEREIAIELMGRCGLRASEVPIPCNDGLRWSEDGECWLLEVRGKNTKGGAKATRDVWIPNDVEDDLRKFSRERGLDTTEPFVDYSVPSIRRWVKEAAEGVATRTGNDRWTHLSSHDLRRSWATYHLVERGVDVRTMMAIGGWSDYSAIEPYLREPTESRIGETMRNSK